MMEVAASASSWKESWRGMFMLEYVEETTRREGDGLVKGDGIGSTRCAGLTSYILSSSLW